MPRPARLLSLFTTVLVAGTLLTAPSATANRVGGNGHRPDRTDRVLIIGHRGASGYRPEHTLASYELAARMGADYIEPDLVSTKDHILIARHENDITGTTDVVDHPEFADRKATKTIDGQAITGWFSEDFTLAEIKTLHAKERLPDVRQHNTIYDDLYPIPTFAEILALRASLSRELGRTIGVYPETKHPTYFRGIGLDLETPLVATLRKAGLADRNAPVFIQSFELKNLALLRTTYHVTNKLVFLTSSSGSPYGDTRSYADLISPAGLAIVAKTADGIGPDKLQIIPRDPAGNLSTPTTLVGDAHAAGLLVHPYTFRAENQFLPANLHTGTDPAGYGRILDELNTYLNTGIDGFFTDQADIGFLARTQYQGS
jgi:glycerophosphoryl diester phosphodiesterase